MRPPIDGSVTLITGASSGIGREIARQLAPRVKALVLVARRTERLEELKKELLAKHPSLVVDLQPCDLSDRAATDAFLERVAKSVGPVDILVNNAGLGSIGIFEKAPWDKLEQIIKVDVTALVYLTHRLYPGMLERRRGGILNISSGAGLHFIPGFAVYTASKNFVTAFTESIRIEARHAGVVVSQVCPGPVATEFEVTASEVPGFGVPSFMNLSVERCVRWTLKGFDRGRALIVPGYLMNVVLFITGWAPRFARRIVLRGLIALFRKHQTRVAAATAAKAAATVPAATPPAPVPPTSPVPAPKEPSVS